MLNFIPFTYNLEPISELNIKMEAEIKNAGKKNQIIYKYLRFLEQVRQRFSYTFGSDCYLLSMNPDPFLYLTWTKNPDPLFHLELICTKIFTPF